ncbi:MAG: butyrate kinase [Candidatus Eremiobacteraeota bacterium]|nr:butyrate kinase [Candidatus Eremiobacteraeota bacterium]
MSEPLILAVNPGSMTTKVALFRGDTEVAAEDLGHGPAELSACQRLIDQLPLRKEAVEKFLKKHEGLGHLDALACRGAPLKPLEGGTYRVGDALVEDIRQGRLQSPHVSMLAALIGHELSVEYGIPAYIVDPISVDEYSPLAHLSGFPEIPRKSLWHALNCRAVAHRYAREQGRDFDELNLIVAHLGSGITVVALRNGKAVDSTDANSEAPFSPERAGTLPMLGFLELCFSGTYKKEELVKKITRGSGLLAHLGTNDCVEVERRIAAGDKHAALVYEAMAYFISKTIGGLAAALNGTVDAVLLTGSLARSKMVTSWISQRVAFIAPVHLYPGQEEMKSLARAVHEVLSGQEQEKIYQ